MMLKLKVNANNPPTDALITVEVVNYEKKEIDIVWCNDWKDSGNLKLLDSNDQLLAESGNEVIRYIGRTIAKDLYGNLDICGRTQVDHWLSFAIGPLCQSPVKNETLSYLNKILMTNTWLVNKKLTAADISVFCVLLNLLYLEKYEKLYPCITRWYKQMLSLPAVIQALSSIKDNKIIIENIIQVEETMNKKVGARKQEGKFIDLPGAEMGKVVVRFPPEASGYLHIGHAKAALLNQYYAETFKGQLIMRFDDTNPAKENLEFEEAILEDIRLLNIKPDRFTYTSDYFDSMLDYCTKLIKDGKAFVDDTPALLMKEQRDQKLKSANRDNSIEKNLKLWNEMQKGTEKGQECCVRAKIDHESVNGCLRDPTIYRCKPEPHPRTGTKYKVYPTYDFACPIVDAVENVTHTLRTTEYHDRDVQYYWIIEALELRRPHIWEYSRLNMTNTVLSKRKLTWFVEEGLVDGWDDPRFPTVRGILRRGMTVDGLKQFIIAQGSSRSVVFMEWDKIWAFNKKVIDPIAIRYTALDYDKTVPVNVLDSKEEWVTVRNHPKDPSLGTKCVRVGSKILIEKDDAEALVEGQNATFVNWGNLKIEAIHKKNGVIESIDARLNLSDENYKNTLKITWLPAPQNFKDLIPCYTVYFDHIISKPVLGKDDDFKDFVAKDTRVEIRMLGEAELHRVKKGEIIQLQRKGFFRCDVPYADISPFCCKEQPLILFHIPDGHTASKSTKANVDSKSSVSKTEQKDVNIINDKMITQSSEEIQKQGDKVRQLKAAKASKDIIDQEVKLLLNLKSEYKIATGQEWKPVKSEKTNATINSASANKTNEQLSEEIQKQGDKVRQLKAAKASKDIIDQEVKILLNLKSEYKIATGQEWKPVKSEKTNATINSASANKTNEQLSEEIQKQGDKVRQLKATKASKDIIDQEVKILLNLKSEYKIATGQEWKPVKSEQTNATINSASVNKTNEKLSEEIKKQGDKVRQLKTAKASKDIIDQEVKILLNLKSEYKIATGQEWKPVKSEQTNATINSASVNKTNEKLSEEIKKQGDKVRQLKTAKASKDIIDQEVKILLTLKSEYKTATGQEWKPDKSQTENIKSENNEITTNDKISVKILEQGTKVRQLKSSKAEQSIIDKEVKILLSLKNDYKTVTGHDWKPKCDVSPKKKNKDGSEKSGKKSDKDMTNNETKSKDTDTNKTGTRLGLEVQKEENFADWYSQIITKSGMIEYYDVSGCYILRPWSYAIWKTIKEHFDKQISKLGVQECYFPIFVTRAALEKEKAHIADFAPEVAWVTKCGDSDIAEHIAIRPTSETVMYPAFSKWLRSDTELPLRLNQWSNVVRWEFKDPKPFLRTREFLWQEGHTVFANKEDAEKEVLIILDMYANIYEELLAVPVVKGRKTEKEKFAGGDYTTTVEAFISTSGRAIQGATSHHLGQNFSKMFNIQVEGAVEGKEKIYVYQNSWGMTTRTIGVMIMVHGDDKGLVLPPNVASIQAIIIPCGITATTTVQQRDQLMSECLKLENDLSKDESLRIKSDYANNRTPGWKFNHWELKGVPVRIELGPKDLEKNQVTFVRRDNNQKMTASRTEVVDFLRNLLTEIQSNMFNKAKKNLEDHIKKVEKWEQFSLELNKKNLLLSPFCGEPSCEDNIKADSARGDVGEEAGALAMGAKSLCIPFEQPQTSIPLDNLKCIHPSCKNKPKFYTLFGRSY
uniref:bifunctional glutamate/proline--tRNA ligase n=1 Tax=Vespula vulgaris TaxID=7454 RepID=UPI002124BE2F|nr:bifunctional glutamate/proline--tRNA ligase [Vespula vulgaris]